MENLWAMFFITVSKKFRVPDHRCLVRIQIQKVLTQVLIAHVSINNTGLFSFNFLIHKTFPFIRHSILLKVDGQTLELNFKSLLWDSPLSHISLLWTTFHS